ncbi:MAG: methyl-accepting chemotaxis protein [Leptospiraceae bacterium]|nr:methyl-accepting chemotaxis protein [Leptospiraceae bacterium]MCP5496138.1 methyl-accepting chemotaxis protein [Leptospiraceae bacterium]
MSIKNKLLIAILSFIIFQSILAGTIHYINNSKALKTQIQSDMYNVAKVKQESLNSHYQIIEKQMSFLTQTADIVNLVTQISNSNIDTQLENTFVYKQAFELIQRFQETHWGIYHHIMLASTKGKIFLSPNHEINLQNSSNHINEQISDLKYFSSQMDKSEFTDFFGFKEKDHFHQLILFPIKVGNRVLGVLVAEIEIGHIENLLMVGFENKKARIYLNTLDGIKVVRNKSDFKISKQMNRGKSTAIHKGVFLGEIDSFLGVYLNDKKYPWILCMETDLKEIYGSIESSKTLTFGIALIFLIIGIVVTILISRNFTKPILKVVEGMRSVSHHELQDVKMIRIDTKDELGELVNSFNEMLEDQKLLSKQINAIVSGNFNSEILGIQTKGVKGENLFKKVEWLKSVIFSIKSISEKLAIGSEEHIRLGEKIHDATLVILKQANENQMQFKEMLANIHTIADNSHSLIINITDITGLSTFTKNCVKELNQVVDKTKKLNELILKISQQINTIALNASIEASSAGDTGKKFGVVASEIKDLVKQTMSSVKEVTNISEEFEITSQKTTKAVQDMDKKIVHLLEIGSKIDASLDAQTILNEKMSLSVKDVEEAINTSIHGTESIQLYAKELKSLSDELGGIVTKFII